MRRKDYKAATIDAVVTTIEQREAIRKIGFIYLAGAPPMDFRAAFNRLLATEQSDLRLACWQAIAQRVQPLPLAFIEGLSQYFGVGVTYQEVQLFLRILEARQLSSPVIHAQLIKLLEEDDFLIARVVYWYLRTEEVTETVRAKLDLFYATQHEAGRL